MGEIFVEKKLSIGESLEKMGPIDVPMNFG
jgi:hypothetical protein